MKAKIAEYKKIVRFSNVRLVGGDDVHLDGCFQYSDSRGTLNVASFPLFLIGEAWGKVDYEDLADGFGAGMGTQGDWSAIRDSSDEAKEKMLERALNAIFGE